MSASARTGGKLGSEAEVGARLAGLGAAGIFLRNDSLGSSWDKTPRASLQHKTIEEMQAT
jgi:hypothetical protein